MKKIFPIFIALGFVVFAASLSSAHVGPDYFAVQVPIEGTPGMPSNIMTIVHDGDPSEWANVDPKFWITHDELVEGIFDHGVNPADLGVRVIIGWSPITNKVYWFEDRFDDVYVGWAADFPQETVVLGIDANHSGGQYQIPGWDGDPDRFGSAQAQDYRYFLIREDPVWLWGAATWVNVAPYSGFGWSFDGDLGDPGNLIVEMGVTPFDDLNFAGIDQSIVHTLQEGSIIGLGFAIEDADALGDDCCLMAPTGGGTYMSNGGNTGLYGRADFFNDFILLPFDPEQWVINSAVEKDTWGRIKSTFSN